MKNTQTLYNIDTHAEKSWSMLDSRPVLKYIPHCDDYIVFWNGVAMTHKCALVLAMKRFCKVGITPEMKKQVGSNYKTMYYSGAFGHRNWDSIMENHSSGGIIMNYIGRLMIPHFDSMEDRTSPCEVLGWFNYNRTLSY